MISGNGGENPDFQKILPDTAMSPAAEFLGLVRSKAVLTASLDSLLISRNFLPELLKRLPALFHHSLQRLKKRHE
jgi:hypothetical protein